MLNLMIHCAVFVQKLNGLKQTMPINDLKHMLNTFAPYYLYNEATHVTIGCWKNIILYLYV